ncbi:Predicted flavoprotein CzcO associated with the cation diffusion facilitator CzcD [Thermomonospora echinospora]|uniref:Predicted flavoprotein CzcO associated with the cation diffusion facilitator CzcD n=1 Tax=Thermomonospora echinospora TaxID=1992 RepID=A0A1H5VN76_9ACTN|nr:NAD(P)/FAD-dependent oxidoreductase [Thermomonospora echinospora]SEF88759.1 Predicted flavoprotein CzcO associated with the cation diffusion facilitator CzcD [Thermomonospora echinospora]
MSTRPAIVIIGTGFGGLGMAIQLIRSGFHDFLVLEKSGDLGGTWRENTYPGCACDVPSHMYSFSFELNPGWTRMFAPQREIQEYLHRTADKYGVKRYIRYNSKVERMEYDDAAQRWEVTLADGTRYRPKAVVSGIGALHIPSYPDLPGLDTFKGTTFHSAEWDHTYDLTGKRVAVIGTGASAIQFVPKVAEQAAQLHVFQRTAPWIQPKPDKEFGTGVRAFLKTVPGAARTLRYGIYWALEARAVGFTVDPRLSGPMDKLARRHIRRQIADPELRRKVTPDYTIGCKRVLLSNDYYPALTRPNVDLITEGVAEVREHSIVTGDGRELEVDCIIYGTGFKVVDALAEQQIVGRGGVKLQELWAEGAEAHHGVTLPGFPNFFMLLGPNTGLGHNSVVFMIEVQIQHILSCLRLLAEQRADTIEPRPEAVRRFNDRMHRRLRRAVWNEGGCTSWYLDANGVNRTLWPGFTFEYWLSSRRARPADYVIG